MFQASLSHPNRRWFVVLILITGVLVAERLFRKLYWDKPTPVTVADTNPDPAPPTVADTSPTPAPVEPTPDATIQTSETATTNAEQSVDLMRKMAQPIYAAPNDETGDVFFLNRRGLVEVQSAAIKQLAASLPNVKDRTGGASKQVTLTRRQFDNQLDIAKPDGMEQAPPAPDRDFFNSRDAAFRENATERFTVDHTNTVYKHPDRQRSAYVNGDIMTEYARITSADRPALYPVESTRVTKPEPRAPFPDRLQDLHKPPVDIIQTMFRPQMFANVPVAPDTAALYDRGATALLPEINTKPHTRRFGDRTEHFALPKPSNCPANNVSADINAPCVADECMPQVGREVAINNVMGQPQGWYRDMVEIALRNERIMPKYGAGNPEPSTAALGGGTGNALSTSCGTQRKALIGATLTEPTQRRENNPRIIAEARQSVASMDAIGNSGGTLRDTGTHPCPTESYEDRMRLMVKKQNESNPVRGNMAGDDQNRLARFTFRPFEDTMQMDDYNQRKELDIHVPPRINSSSDRQDFERQKPCTQTSWRATRQYEQ